MKEQTMESLVLTPQAADLTRTDAPPMRTAVVGCGNVSGDYFESCARYAQLDVVACADVHHAVAEQQAARYGIAEAKAPDEVMADPTIELVVNLTPPAVHADVTLQAIAAGKHVFTEKPLGPTLAVADGIIAAARAAGVAVGCAPAAFLGGGLQTCRKVIDDGWIGEPVAATAFFTSRGYEHWHPFVDSYYGEGGGPMLDIGPYSVTALLSFLGPVSRVSASTKRFSETRPRPGRFAGSPEVPVQVSTHAAGTLDFVSGAVATVITSWEIWSTRLPYIEIYGTEGSLSVPNPDAFDGTPVLRRPELGDLAQDPTVPSGGSWYELPLTHRGDVGRGIAVADMADALRTGRPFRANAEFAYHALEVMLAFDASSEANAHIEPSSRCERPAPLPTSAPGTYLAFH